MVKPDLILSIESWLEACEAWLEEHQELETLWPMKGQTGPLVSGIGQVASTTCSVWPGDG